MSAFRIVMVEAVSDLLGRIIAGATLLIPLLQWKGKYLRVCYIPAIEHTMALLIKSPNSTCSSRSIKGNLIIIRGG